jgi:hypothetical protein
MTQIPTIGMQSLIAIPREENVRDLHQCNQILWTKQTIMIQGRGPAGRVTASERSSSGGCMTHHWY